MLTKIIKQSVWFLLMLVLASCVKNDKVPKSIVVFGDSLSDQGNIFSIVNHVTDLKNIHMSTPPSSHDGHAFSNKLLAVEYLAQHYGLKLSPAWRYKKSSANINKIEGSYSNIFASSALNNDFQKEKKTSQHHKEVSFLIETILDNIHSPTLAGNNYAVSNATIASDYSGLVDRLFNHLSLPYQIKKYTTDNKKDIKDTLFVIMIGGNDIINIVRSSAKNKKQKISNLMPIMVDSIQRLQALGAKKILVIGTPNVGETPVFYNTPLEKITAELSEQFNQELGQKITEYFSKKQVEWLPISKQFSETLQKWPANTRHEACVSDIVNHTFNLRKFLEHEELEVKFNNGCTQLLLNEGKYAFYDLIHGSDAIYQNLSKLLIHKASDFFSQ
jgi:phospholipase/lecithinase/hemolysin